MKQEMTRMKLALATLLVTVSCRHIPSDGSKPMSAKITVAMPQASAPSPRAMTSALWTGSSMIVWGGVGVKNDVLTRSEGAIYFPSENRWQEIPKVEATSRFHHSAIWTGKYLAVWGGVDSRSNERLNSGWLYNVEHKEWIRMSSEKSPSPRSGHSAVWTGKYMVVWGGETEAGVLQDGAMYDPEADTWTEVASDLAPPARSFHTVAWSGEKMMVWGGIGEEGVLNSGAMFDPALNTWKPMSVQGAPESRVSHSVVWTGTKMIVWGGRDGGEEFFDDGGLYDPIQDKWTPLASSKKFASPRELHTAIWTDKEMIIWGGHNGERVLAGGAAYNPNSNTWRAIRDSDKSVARSQHAAVWTGADMLVFGGRASSGKFVSKKVGVAISFEKPSVAQLDQ